MSAICPLLAALFAFLVVAPTVDVGVGEQSETGRHVTDLHPNHPR